MSIGVMAMVFILKATEKQCEKTRQLIRGQPANLRCQEGLRSDAGCFEMSTTEEDIAAAAAMNGFDEPIRFSEPDKLEDGVSFVAYHPRLPCLWLTITRAPDDWTYAWRVRAWQIVHSPVDFAKKGEEIIWGMPKLGSTEYGSNSVKTVDQAIEFAKQAAKGELNERYKSFVDNWHKAKRVSRRNVLQDGQQESAKESLQHAPEQTDAPEQTEWLKHREDMKNIIVSAVALSKRHMQETEEREQRSESAGSPS